MKRLLLILALFSSTGSATTIVVGPSDCSAATINSAIASATKPAALSSYTPYTYPHPLQGVASPPPAPAVTV